MFDSPRLPLAALKQHQPTNSNALAPRDASHPGNSIVQAIIKDTQRGSAQQRTSGGAQQRASRNKEQRSKQSNYASKTQKCKQTKNKQTDEQT